MHVNRRTALRTLGAGLAGALAGCSASDDQGSSRGDLNETDSGPSDSGGQSPGSWRLLSNDPHNRTYADEAGGPGTSPEVRWAWRRSTPDDAQMSALNFSPPVVDDGLAFTVVSGRHVYPDGTTTTTAREEYVNELVAVDAASGERRWRHEFTDGVYAASTLPAAAGNGTVVFSHFDLYAVDAASGERDWSVETDGTAVGPPSVVDDDVFVPLLPSEDGDALAVYDVADGTKRWSALDYVSGYASVAVTDDAVYVASREGVIALERAGGAELWRSPAGTESHVMQPGGSTPVHTPVVDGESVYVAGGFAAAAHGDAGALVSLDRSDGTENWRFQPERTKGEEWLTGVHGVPVLSDGTLYVTGYQREIDTRNATQDHALYAVDAADGSRLWKVPIERSTPFPVGADGAVYVVTGKGIAAYSTADGTQLTEPTPLLEDDVLAPFEGVGIAGDALVTRTHKGIAAFASDG